MLESEVMMLVGHRQMSSGSPGSVIFSKIKYARDQLTYLTTHHARLKESSNPTSCSLHYQVKRIRLIVQSKSVPNATRGQARELSGDDDDEEICHQEKHSISKPTSR